MGTQLDSSLSLLDANGNKMLCPIDMLYKHMHDIISTAATNHGITSEELQSVYAEAVNNLFDGAKFSEVNTALKIALRTRIELNSNYTYLVAAVLDNENRTEVCTILGLPLDATDADILLPSIKHGIKVGRISPKVLEKFSEEDIIELSKRMVDERSSNFTYLGLQTLYDRYFLHDNEVRYETAQVFFMRVAIGHAFNESREDASQQTRTQVTADRVLKVNPVDKFLDSREDFPIDESVLLDNALWFICDLYDAYSKFEYMSSTPTLFNSATIAPQMSSCYLTSIPDDLHGIYQGITDDAMLSKFAGGLGNDWTQVRALNSWIKGTNGKSQGIIPFLKVANDTAVAVNQCFDPTTPMYTANGVKSIESINIGDLVLGKSGNYKPVMDVMSYNQKDDMRIIKVKHGFEPFKVTAGHPFLVLRGNPKGGRTNPNNFKLEWVEAKDLSTDDMIAQVIPKEFTETTLTVDDALMYGILLGDGHCTTSTNEWGITGVSSDAGHIVFAKEYLDNLGIHTWTTGDCGRVQLRWAKNEDIFPFNYSDIYNEEGKKYIHPNYLNLNNVLALNIIKGLLITDGNISRGKEITFSTTSVELLHGLRYLLLKIETPSSVYTRTRTFDHVGTRNDGSTFVMDSTTTEHVLRIPASDKVALLVSVPSLTKRNWIVYNGYVFTRVKSNDKMLVPSETVYDLIVEGDESYMTVNGLAHNGGKRKGAMCAYLESWHLDIEEFLELRKNTGDDRRRTHDMNTANWIPDLFMKRVIEDGTWTLFTPNEVPDLHDLYGTAFEERYKSYEIMAEELGLMHKVVKANDLWRKMLGMLFETGHPWLTYKDPCNVRSPQQHVGVVHSSNLCCIAKDQRVVTDSGMVLIDDLYKSQVEPMVAGRGHLAQASAMLLPRPNAEMVKIHTKEGYTHKVTPDHRVWVDGKGIVEAQCLVAGDKLELQWTSLFGNVDKPELAFLTGLLAGDGTFTESGVRLDFWKGKTDQVAYDAIAAASHVIIESDLDFGSRAKVGISLCDTEIKKFFHSANLMKLLAEEGVTKETKLKVPDFVWQGNKFTVAEYLRGLFITDGTVNATNDLTSASLSSVSKELLLDVQLLLLNFGIKSSVTLMREESLHSMPDGNGGTKEYNCQAMYRLHVTSLKHCNLLEKITQIGYYRNNNQYLNNLLTKKEYDIKLLATFVDLEQLPNEDAYCLTVDSIDHAWTVNGFITHNTEITLNTVAGQGEDAEIAVCNLGSINVVEHVNEDGTIDMSKLQRTINIAVRALDNVIDSNMYPVKAAERSNLKHRPIGLGIMGFQDALFKMGIDYASQAAVEFADKFQELVSYFAISASCALAKTLGKYESFNGSLWSQGILPIDTLKMLEKQRGEDYCDFNYDSFIGTEAWDALREQVKLGMRNSNVMAIAPTATISNICGVSQSIEPVFQNVYVKSNLSGEFTVVNPYLQKELTKLGLWNKDVINEIKSNDGSIQLIDSIPLDLRNRFCTAFEVGAKWLVECAARRQKWIDQSQSLNLYIAGASGKKLDTTYKMGWIKGLKTTYYLRALSATQTEKVTGKSNLNAVKPVVPEFAQAAAVPGACSIDNPDCEACQ